MAKEKTEWDQGKYHGKLLTLKEAAKYIRMGESTLYQHRHKVGFIQPPKGKILFHIDALDAWIDVGTIPAGTISE